LFKYFAASPDQKFKTREFGKKRMYAQYGYHFPQVLRALFAFLKLAISIFVLTKSTGFTISNATPAHTVRAKAPDTSIQ
jgi:hypothetical protein